MSLKRWALIAAWMMSLIAVSQWQAVAQPQNAEVRFRIEGVQNGKVFGSFIVNQNGNWLEIGPGPAKAQPALTR